MNRRRTSLPSWPFLLSAVAVLLAGGVALFFLLTHEEPRSGGTYIEGIAGSPTTLNPLLASFNETDEDLTSLIFAGLTKLDQRGAIEPGLAQEWSISGDGKSYTFSLKPGTTWQDGQPLTADDVVFTVNQLRDRDFPGNPEMASVWRQVRPEKVDNTTVRLSLEQAFSPFLTYASTGIIPAHKFQGVSTKDMATAAVNRDPVGAGPFKLKEASLEHVVLEASPTAPQPRPYLNTLEFIFMRDDQTLAAALNTNQVQGGLLRPTVGRQAVESVRENGNLHSFAAPRASFTILFLNSLSPTFKNKILRQAVAYGIDRNRLVEEVTGGLAVPASGPIARTSWAFDKSVPWYEYSPAKAAQLLEQEGWKLNGAGIREKDGQPLRFTLYTNDDTLRVAASESLGRDLKRLGMLPDVASSGTAGLMQNFLLPRKYDAIIYGIDPGSDPDPYPLWHSSQAGSDGLNVATVTSPQFDLLLEKGRMTTTQDDRRAIYEQFQELFEAEVPSIPLYHPLYTYAVDKRVRGVKLDGLLDPSSRFYGIERWYTDTQRALGR